MLFAVPFAGFGILHLVRTDMFVGMVPSFIPGGAFWVYLLGVGMLFAASSFVTGVWVRQAALGIVVMLLIFITTLWLPRLLWPESTSLGGTLAGLFKDFGLLGGALMVFAGTDSQD